MNAVAQIKSLLTQPKKIAITTHQKPDADAMGSSLALKQYLEKKGHDVTVVVPTDYAPFLNWMSGNDEVIIYSETKHEEITSIFQTAKIIFTLDFNSLSRINELGDIVKNSNATKILVDHHQQPEGFEDIAYWDDKKAATAELIYELINDLGETALIDEKIGECIYAGIMTDTGSFRFPSTTKRVHEIIGNLIACGVDNAKVHRLIYDTGSEDKLRFTGYAISEKLVVKRDLKTAYISITEEELKRFNSKTGDTEGLVNYALSIDGIVFACLFTDRGGIIKISFRSIGEFNVNKFARDHFDGGGHNNAAGGATHISLEETIKMFENLLPSYKDELNSVYSNEKILSNH